MVHPKGLELSRQKRGGLPITHIGNGSIAQELGIEIGDRVISINNREINDAIDYRFFSGEESLLMELIKENGEVWEIDIEKEVDEEIGLDFDPMKIRQCPNKCFFCFVDQNPTGQRNELYIRDEDYRFSFLFGNYITLTNLTKRDKERVFEQRLSPLYISVHTTDPELRKFMLGNPKARPIMTEIQEMMDHNITLQTQVVLCPGVNDGKYLIQSIEDLARYYPGVGSLAIVPIGITGHREGLYPIKEVTQTYAREALAILRPWQEHFTKKFGYPFVFPSDEFFIKADLPFPPLSDYYDLSQLENGVGLVPLFMEQMKKGVRALPKKLPTQKRVSLVTGRSFLEYLHKALAMVHINGLTLQPLAIRNDFFGQCTTVTGLLTGQDIIAQLKTVPLGDLVLVPQVMLNEKGLFLDNKSPKEVETALGVPVVMVQNDAEGLVNFLKTLA